MLITWISFKAKGDGKFENLDKWKILENWVLVSICDVFHPHALSRSKCLVLEHIAYPARSVALIVYGLCILQI